LNSDPTETAFIQPGIFYAVPTTLTVLHPKGGVGRSATAYILGAELALRGHRVALIDRDQGAFDKPVWTHPQIR
jgi:Mrp family chromosome partitioning ATPase